MQGEKSMLAEVAAASMLVEEASTLVEDVHDGSEVKADDVLQVAYAL